MEYTSTRLHTGLEKFTNEIKLESARNIQLLNAINITITIINRITSQLHSDAEYTEKFIKEIDSFTGCIDPDNTIAKKLEDIQAKAMNVHEVLIALRESGRICTWLNDDDGMDESCTEAIAAAADLHNNLNDLRWHIMEHDADFSEVSTTFKNADDLLKSLTA